MGYRPDIDGLRTIAVLSVLFYHFGVPGFDGGFIGVDVFFVISGFLITRLIVNEVSETGSISLFRFYVRRLRRLFPALAVTVGVSLVASFLLFSPYQLEEFARSAVFAVVGMSNVLFWMDSGYFDAEAYTKPLLHTWSLSVEEQFYLLWPIVLTAVLQKFSKNIAGLFVVILSVLSLIGAEIILFFDASAAFFLMPARVAELGIGAGLVWCIGNKAAKPRHLEILLPIGLLMIAAAVFTYSSETRFPGASALLPCIGTAIAIYAGAAPRVGVVLRNAVATNLGKWSYSIYLVHWPLYVFFVAYTYRDPDAGEIVLLTATSIALGWVQYRFVEERFRHERSPRAWSRTAYASGCIGSALAAIIISGAIWESDGIPSRVPEGRVQKTNSEWRREEWATYCRNINPSLDQELFTCQNWRGKDKTIVLWGDSHALHLVAGFSHHFPDHNILVSYMSGCVPQSGFGGYLREMNSLEDRQHCADRNHATLSYLSENAVDLIVVTSAKRDTPEEVAGPINLIFNQLATASRSPAVYLADFIRPGRELIDCVNVPDLLISDVLVEQRCQGDRKVSTREYQYNQQMAKLIKNFVQVNDIQCPSGECRFFDGITPLFRDTHHLSIPGSIAFIQSLRYFLRPLMSDAIRAENDGLTESAF